MNSARRSDPLVLAALVIVFVKFAEFAIDSQVLFYSDSAAFLRNALGMEFLPTRSYVYGWLMRFLAFPFGGGRAVVGMQVVMGGLTAWLLAFLLIRFLRVRPWISVAAALLFAVDPVQVVHEHMIMAETAALFAMAVFLTAALQYMRTPTLSLLTILSLLGVLLVSFRVVYVPVVLAFAALLPVLACSSSCGKRLPALALALAVSCGSALLSHWGYQYLTGWLAGRGPAYNYQMGEFLLATVTPIVKPGDSPDSRVAEAVVAQSKSAMPLVPEFRSRQLWQPDGLVARLRSIFLGDERLTDESANKLAWGAIRRNPLAFAGLGLHTYFEFWTDIPELQTILESEDGAVPPHAMDGHHIGVFAEDVSKQDHVFTPSRKYHVWARYWYVFLLLSPFLNGIAWLRSPEEKALAVLFWWSLLLLGASCFGVEAAYRFLQPFSFTGLAATAVLIENCFDKGVSEPRVANPRNESSPRNAATL